MRNAHRHAWLLLMTAALLPSDLFAQDDPDPSPRQASARRRPARDEPDDAPRQTQARRTPAPAVIGSRQIDRYEAIRQLKNSVKSDPSREGDCILLGELAHEVALDLPSDQDDPYYQLSREAYEKALRLDPDNAGLAAAVKLAREQDENSQQFDANRTQSVRTYLAARRREVEASGYRPTIQVAQADPGPAEDDDQPVPSRRRKAQSNRQAAAPSYQSYDEPGQPPVTYQQYAKTYAPATQPAAGQPQPSTLRGLAQQLPEVLFNEVKGGAATASPR